MRANFCIKVCEDTVHNDAITEVFSRLNYNLIHRHWVRWKYEENPYGLPILILAFDRRDKLVGMQVNLPRLYQRGDLEFNTVQAVDAIVDPKMRRQGVYREIWRTTQRLIRERRLVLMTYPSINGMSIGAMKKANLHPLGYMELLYCPIRPSVILASRGKLSFLAPLARLIMDFYPNLLFSMRKPQVLVKLIKNFAVPEDFPSRKIRGCRTKEYLNWRFIDNPIDDIHALEFEDDSGYIGFAALRLNKNGRTIDILDFVTRKIEVGCIRALQAHIYKNYPNVGLIYFKTLQEGPFIDYFRRCGFFVGGKNQILFVDNLEEHNLVTNAKEWFVNLGDSDW